MSLQKMLARNGARSGFLKAPHGFYYWGTALSTTTFTHDTLVFKNMGNDVFGNSIDTDGPWRVDLLYVDIYNADGTFKCFVPIQSSDDSNISDANFALFTGTKATYYAPQAGNARKLVFINATGDGSGIGDSDVVHLHY